MNLLIKNEHLYFSMYTAWNSLDYRLKTQINEKVIANSDNDYMQTIDLSISDLKDIINSVNALPQGIAREINPQMFISIFEQLSKEANKGDKDALEMLQLIQSITVTNDKVKQSYIEQGKLQILQ